MNKSRTLEGPAGKDFARFFQAAEPQRMEISGWI
jgi:hypothetical protein